MQQEMGTFLKYGLVGLVSNLVLYGLFLLLLVVGVPAVAASMLCYVLGVAASYLANRSWSFASTQTHRQDLPKFMLAYGLGLVSTAATISLLLMWLPAAIAQVLNIGVTAVIIYACLRLFRFGDAGA